MGQLHVYLPNLLEQKIREDAKKLGLSISAYLSEMARTKLEEKNWSSHFFELAGSWEGDFPELERELPQERDLDVW